MLGYGVRVKLPLALVIISGILWKAWKPIKDQYVGTPIVADRPVGLLVWGFSVGQQASGMPATVGIRVKNNTVKTIKLKTAYAVAVRKAALLLPEERAVFAVQAVQDEVFSRAEEYFANSRRENSLLTQEIPPGQLTMYIYGNPLNQERFAELSHGSMSIYFAGIMEYEVEGASKRITYCGYTSAQLKTIPLCGQHNDAEADALPSR